MIAHQARFKEGDDQDLYYTPYKKDKRFWSQHMLGRFVTVALCAMFFIVVSFLTGAYLGAPKSTEPDVVFQALVIGVLHQMAMHVCFEINVASYLYIQLNPYITFADFALHRTLGLIPCLVQILGQVVGATLGALVSYAVLASGPPFLLSNVDANISNNASLGWVFLLESFWAMVFAWVVWHNFYQHKQTGHRVNNHYAMATVVALASATSFPVAGITVQNPLRWLTACTVAGGCGNTGWWIFAFGPLVGMLLGYCLHLLTWNVKIRG